MREGIYYLGAFKGRFNGRIKVSLGDGRMAVTHWA